MSPWGQIDHARNSAHKMITNTIPLKLFFVILRGFAPSRSPGKGGLFQGITYEIRNDLSKIFISE